MISTFRQLTIHDLLRIHNFVTRVKEKKNFNTYRETFDYIVNQLDPESTIHVYRHKPLETTLRHYNYTSAKSKIEKQKETIDLEK